MGKGWSTVEIDEPLLRAIKRSQPDVIDSKGRVTSACFKNERRAKGLNDPGISVDRQDNRTMEEATEFLSEKLFPRLRGIARIYAGEVIEAKAVVLPSPTSSDEYHAEIFGNAAKEALTNLQALQLADACELQWVDEEWHRKNSS